jgi:transcriptional regulator with XRE-family HTH domain
MNANKIGNKLIDQRTKKGETQKDVADAIGTSVSTVAMYESGKRIPKDDLKVKLANHFECSVTTLFYCD